MWVWVPILGKWFQAQLSWMERRWPAQYLVSSGIDGERSWRMGGKRSGKNVPRNPLHNLPENLLNTWPVLTVFIGLILGTKKIKDSRTPTGLGNSYWGSADSGAFVTYWEVASPESLSCTHCHSPVCGGFEEGSRKQETRDCKGIKI